MAEDRKQTAKSGEAHSSWLDRPRNVDRIVWAIYAISAALFLIDPLFPKHGPFEVEHLVGFYAIFGFIGCVFLVLAARELHEFLKRAEDYYER